MNRFKKELSKRGYKMEKDYPYLPFNEVEAIMVDSEHAILFVYHFSTVLRLGFDRQMNDFDLDATTNFNKFLSKIN